MAELTILKSKLSLFPQEVEGAKVKAFVNINLSPATSDEDVAKLSKALRNLSTHAEGKNIRVNTISIND